MLPWLIFLSVLGRVVACAILVDVVDAWRIGSLYQRHELIIARLCGVMFIGFAITARIPVLSGLMSNQA